MKYIVKKDLVATFDTYSAYDENNNKMYLIKTEFLSNVKTFKVYDNNEKEINILKRKFTSILPEFDLYENNNQIGFIKKIATIIKPKYNISDKYEAVANSFNTKYIINDQNNNKIAELIRIEPSAESIFEINTDSSEDILLFILMVVVSEELRVRNNKKRKTRRG